MFSVCWNICICFILYIIYSFNNPLTTLQGRYYYYSHVKMRKLTPWKLKLLGKDHRSQWVVEFMFKFKESSPTPQFKSINSSHSAFFIVQISHPYMTTGKTIALTRQTFVGKVMPLLFNMLSRIVIPFLPRSKHLFLWGH